MRVLLINPPFTGYTYDTTPNLPPLGLMYIAAALRKDGHELNIFDFIVGRSYKKIPIKYNNGRPWFFRYSVSDQEFIDFLNGYEPDIIGISNNTATTEWECIRIAAVIKKEYSDIPIIVGGINCSARKESILKNNNIDFVVSGDGEYALCEFLKKADKDCDWPLIPGLSYKKNNQLRISETSSVLENINDVDMPAWDLIDFEAYQRYPFPVPFHLKKRITIMLTSKGCVRNCIFCSGRKFFGPLRSRYPERVIEEALLLKDKFGIQEIHFQDANLTYNRERIEQILNLWKKKVKLPWSASSGVEVNTIDRDLIRLMSESGCHSLVLGIEHASVRMQRLIGKLIPIKKVQEICDECRRQGIWIHGSFVIGLPGETKEDTLKILSFCRRAKIDSLSLFSASPLPGSRLYDIFKQKGGVFDPDIFRILNKDFVMADTCLKEAIGSIQFKIFRDFLLWKLFLELRPSSILERLRSPNFRNLIIVSFNALKRFVSVVLRDKQFWQWRS